MKKSVSYINISPTAKGVAYFRSLTGIPHSDTIANGCKAKEAILEIFSIQADDLNWMAPLIESRYESIQCAIRQYIANNHLNAINIVELASGLSPHGLIFTMDPCVNYIEVDLNGILDEKKRIVKDILSCEFCGGDPRQNLKFIRGNVLDRNIFKKIEIKLIKGPIIFICEGLLPYFDIKEKGILSENILYLLRKYGGVWITPDISSKDRIKTMIQMDPNLTKVIEFLSGVTHCDIEANSFSSLDEARTFFKSKGFNIVERKQSDIVPDLRSLSLINEIEIVKVKAMLKKGYIWEMESK